MQVNTKTIDYEKLFSEVENKEALFLELERIEKQFKEITIQNEDLSHIIHECCMGYNNHFNFNAILPKQLYYDYLTWQSIKKGNGTLGPCGINDVARILHLKNAKCEISFEENDNNINEGINKSK